MINILYASEMGTAFELALDIEAHIKEQNIEVECGEMDDYTVEQLKDMDKVMMVCSTTGDGDVPMMGENLWEALENSDADLQTVNYSMCALGDSSHSTFCGAGRKIDARMMEMGAKAIVRRHECDADTDGAEEWSKEVLEKLKVI